MIFVFEGLCFLYSTCWCDWSNDWTYTKGLLS